LKLDLKFGWCLRLPLAVSLAAAALTSSLLAGGNPTHKIAVHVMPHGTTCESLPTFTDCSQIQTTYAGIGDIDVVPVFFNLNEYYVVEFGLSWPAAWGSMEYTKCAGELHVGDIVNPGEGIATAWTTCQRTWSVAHGFGWLKAAGPGSVTVVRNPPTNDYGVVDCAPGPDMSYDYPSGVYNAGIGGPAGDDPCQVIFIPLGLIKSDGLGGQCVEPGEDLAYRIDYSSAANPAEVHDVVIEDILPAETEFVSASSGGTYSAAEHSVTWQLGTLAPGSSGSVSVTATAPATPGSWITNTCGITSSETPPNQAATSTMVCEPSFDPLNLTMDDSLGTDCVRFGENVTCHIFYDNSPNSYDVHNVIICYYLPPHTFFVSASAGADYDLSHATVTWQIGNLAPNASGHVHVVIRVEAPLGSTVSNKCAIQSDETSPRTIYEPTAVCLSSEGNPNLKMAVHAVPTAYDCPSLPQVPRCSDISTSCPTLGDIYVVPVLFNLSEFKTADFGLEWPAEWGSMMYAACAGDEHLGSITYPGDGMSTTWTECQHSWSVAHGYGLLHATDTGLVSIVANPGTGLIGVADCAADPSRRFDQPSDVFRAGVGDRSGDDPCGTDFYAIRLSKSDNQNGSCVYVGTPITYTIRYDNRDNRSSIHDVVLVDYLGAVEPVDCHGGIYDDYSHSVTWNIGTLAPADAGCESLLVRVISSGETSILNTCEISSAEAPASEDAVSTSLCGGGLHPLGLVITAAAGYCADYGSDVTYNIRYDNSSNPVVVHNAVLMDMLPGGTSFVQASHGGVYNGAGRVTWDLGSLAPGAGGDRQITLTVLVAQGSRFTNNCFLSSDEAPPSDAGCALTVCGGSQRNQSHKIAIHVVAHPVACKAIPAFTSCDKITTTFAGTGDIDAIPVIYDLFEYSVVEFGLVWPAEWGTCEFIRCKGDIAVGGITHPGEGVAIAWTACQYTWAVAPGIAWLKATGPGLVSPCFNPATGDMGVVNCAPSPGPYYDYPQGIAQGGIGGIPGDDPCFPTRLQPTTWGAIKAMFK
jgi:uncharacterized repeat protein (TIGR01451 family)